jgi:hypothetical protein
MRGEMFESLQERIRPQLRISYQAQEQGCLITEERDPYRQVTFYRLQIENTGVVEIEDCCGVLKSLRGDQVN